MRKLEGFCHQHSIAHAWERRDSEKETDGFMREVRACENCGLKQTRIIVAYALPEWRTEPTLKAPFEGCTYRSFRTIAYGTGGSGPAPRKDGKNE